MVGGVGFEPERVLAAVLRHLEDAHGFRGLRLEATGTTGEVVAYRVLPSPYPGPAGRLRLVPLGPQGRPLAQGARRLDRAEVIAVLETTLAGAEKGWLVSATRTAGLEATFGPDGVKVAFRSATAVAPRIPVDGPVAGRAPAPLALPEREPAAGSGDLSDLLPETEAATLLSALGLTAPNGRLRRDDRRKYNQITHFLRLVEGLISRLPSGREVLVVDCGCGKSQLLFVLNFWMTERLSRRAYFVGLDLEPGAVAAATRLQAALGYRNMEFVATAIRDWDPPAPPDLVLSLHACDTATDEAIALGAASGATGIVAVPCCQHELSRQVRHESLDPLFAHPVLRDRFADWLTDGLRVLALEACGYSVDAVEYVSPLDTPKNIMLRAAKARRPDRRAYDRYRALRDLFGVRPALDDLLAGVWPASDAPAQVR